MAPKTYLAYILLAPQYASTSPTHLDLSTGFVYDLETQPIESPIITTAHGVHLDEKVYIIDGQLTTASQIDQYHATGKTVYCYFSAGSWEPFRPDHADFPPECYCGTGVSSHAKTGKCKGKGKKRDKLRGWDEWWLDIHSSSCLDSIKEIMTARMQSLQSKGCDGIDPDNVDAFENKQAFGITAKDEVSYLLWLAKTAKDMSMGIDLKNAGDLLVDDNGKPTRYQSELVDAFDFNVIESCHQYDECDKYDSFLAAGKPQMQVEYKDKPRACPALKKGQHLLVYEGTDLDSNGITLKCADG